ncbi:MAG: phosphatidate cytidylyltransferase [Pseudomonadota bacterium]
MSPAGRSWHDLRRRVITGVALAAFGAFVVWAGGLVFALTAAAAAGLILWEIVRMVAPERASEALQIGILAAAAVLLARALPGALTLPLLAAPIAMGILWLRGNTLLFGLYGFAVLVACYGLILARDGYGVFWILWLVLTVVMTDIAGYFGGRAIGGAKFWPSVSPSKTWAGVIAGWLAAALVGLALSVGAGAPLSLVVLSVLLSFASQLGDIAQSAFKRRAGVKDSSTLLPGHGGVFDRFDALLGAALFWFGLALVIDIPELSLG